MWLMNSRPQVDSSSAVDLFIFFTSWALHALIVFSYYRTSNMSGNSEINFLVESNNEAKWVWIRDLWILSTRKDFYSKLLCLFSSFRPKKKSYSIWRCVILLLHILIYLMSRSHLLKSIDVHSYSKSCY